MKRLLYFGMLTMITFLAACGDDEPECKSDDFVGTYSGTLLCPGDNNAISQELFITKISDTQVSLSDDNGFAVLLDVTGCQASGSFIDDGETITTTLNLDGNNLGFVLSGLNDDGVLVSCSGTFMK